MRTRNETVGETSVWRDALTDVSVNVAVVDVYVDWVGVLVSWCCSVWWICCDSGVVDVGVVKLLFSLLLLGMSEIVDGVMKVSETCVKCSVRSIEFDRVLIIVCGCVGVEVTVWWRWCVCVCVLWERDVGTHVHRRCGLVVRTLRCGRTNPGSNPGSDITFICHSTFTTIDCIRTIPHTHHCTSPQSIHNWHFQFNWVLTDTGVPTHRYKS